MAEGNLRVSMLSYLDSLPPGATAKPSDLARRLGAKNIDRVIKQAKLNGEVVVHNNGNVQLSFALKNQLNPKPVTEPEWLCDPTSELGYYTVAAVVLILGLVYCFVQFIRR